MGADFTADHRARDTWGLLDEPPGSCSFGGQMGQGGAWTTPLGTDLPSGRPPRLISPEPKAWSAGDLPGPGPLGWPGLALLTHVCVSSPPGLPSSLAVLDLQGPGPSLGNTGPERGQRPSCTGSRRLVGPQAPWLESLCHWSAGPGLQVAPPGGGVSKDSHFQPLSFRCATEMGKRSLRGAGRKDQVLSRHLLSRG